MPGHAKVTIPAAIPSKPTTTSHQVGTGLALPVKAAISEITPSTSAKAPYSSTSVTRVNPGQTKARMPKMIAAIPRSSSSHQHLASACSIGRPGNGAIISSGLHDVLPSNYRRDLPIFFRFDFGPGSETDVAV